MSSFSLPSPRISGGSQRSSPDHRHFRLSASSRARAKRQGPVQRSPLPTERLNRLIASKRLLQQNRSDSEVELADADFCFTPKSGSPADGLGRPFSGSPFIRSLRRHGQEGSAQFRSQALLPF